MRERKQARKLSGPEKAVTIRHEVKPHRGEEASLRMKESTGVMT